MHGGEPPGGTRALRRAVQDEQRAQKVLSSMTTASTEFILVRHGETPWNAEARLQGQSADAPGLNDLGRLQAELLAQHLRDEPLDHIYTSDLLRCMESAERIAEAKGLQVHADPRLRERHLGVLHGCTYVEAPLQQPEAWAALRSSDTSMPLPGGGESIDALRLRVAGALQNIADLHPGQRILLVVHGGVLHALYRHATGHAFAGKAGNASMHTFRVEGPAFAMVRWNDTDHLQSVGYDGVHTFGGGENEA